MTKVTVKVIVARLAIGAPAALIGGASARSDQRRRALVGCANAYGHGGENHVSRTVTGEREATRGAAQAVPCANATRS